MTAAPLKDRKLRIALFSGNYNYVMDGPVRALNTLVAYLEREGHAVRVYAPTTKKPAFEHAGTLVSVPSVALPGKRSEYRFGLGLNGRLKKDLQAFNPTLIHIAAPDYTAYGALKYAEKSQIPVVASFHTRFDTYPRYYGAKWLEKYLTNYMRHFYGRCEHVYAPSQSMIDELREDGIGDDLRLWTRGVDSVLFNPDKRDFQWRRSVGLNDDDIIIAFVGRLVLEKGIDVFVDAVSKAKGSNDKIRALVVGDGPERSAFEEKLKSGVFTGYQQGEDLARAYASADIFFNPSITETFGNVTLEAMACGLPSIGAAAAGSRTLIEPNVTGLLAEPNADAFIPPLLVLAGSPDRRAAMGSAAREKAERFSWDAVLSELVGNYYQAITEYDPGSSTQK